MPQSSKEGSRPLPTNSREVDNNREIQISGRFVGNGLDRSVPFTRYIVISGAAATGGIYAAPTNQPVVFIIIYTVAIYGRGRGMPRPYRAMIF